jgi:N6-L-threonylcarbamoyladenine synthase
MLYLGIETSCDESAMALLHYRGEGRAEIVSELVSSQCLVHADYGGVVPEIASREHLRALPLLYDQLFIEAKKSGVSPSDIHTVAVTVGPGLKGCLLVGTCFAQALAAGLEKPVVAVNHIEAHTLMPLFAEERLRFPYISLIVSGGHTEVHMVEAVGKYQILARTQDDAAGEAFDKAGALLGFSYPGGPKLAQLAESVSDSRYSLPRGMLERDGFSFSGLKTAVSLLVKKEEDRFESEPEARAELCFTVQQAIVEQLVRKVSECLRHSKVRQLALSGGVAANKMLRRQLSKLDIDVFAVPEPAHCADNGSMIAYTAALRSEAGCAATYPGKVAPRFPIVAL